MPRPSALAGALPALQVHRLGGIFLVYRGTTALGHNATTDLDLDSRELTSEIKTGITRKSPRTYMCDAGDCLNLDHSRARRATCLRELTFGTPTALHRDMNTNTKNHTWKVTRVNGSNKRIRKCTTCGHTEEHIIGSTPAQGGCPR